MKKLINDVIEAKVECFIIPNRIGKISDLSFTAIRNEYKEKMIMISDLNGIEFDPENDTMMELWFTSDDLGSENLVDHGFNFELPDGTVIRGCRINSSLLPTKLFEGKQEGDTVTLNLIGTYMDYRDDINMRLIFKDVMLKCEVRLNQTEYRYRNHGRFEEVMQKIK